MNRLYYVLGVLLMGYASIFFDAIYFRAFLVVFLLLPLVLYGLNRYQKNHLTVKLYTDQTAVRKRASFTVRIIADNDSKLPVSRLAVQLLLQNEFSADSGKVNLGGMADNESITTMEYQVTSEFCGTLRIKASSIKIYDIFGITFCRLVPPPELSVIVMPQIHNMDIQISNSTCSFPVSGDEYDPHRSGDDSSEIFGFREYRDGDRFHQVNWKLSMKSEDLIVREFSLPVGYNVILLLDLASAKQNLPTVGRIDHFIEAAVSISNSLLERSCYHYVSWYSDKEKTLVRHSIKTQDDLFEMTMQLLLSEPYADLIDITDLYHSTYTYDTYAAQMVLDLNLSLQVNDQDQIQFRPGNLHKSLAAASIVV